MNREIKFRAWHKDFKVMLYPPGPADSMILARTSDGKYYSLKEYWVKHKWPRNHKNEEMPMSNLPQFFPCHMTWDGRLYLAGSYQDIEWMQFTGLQDKNGKEIYEGDIVEYYEDKYTAVVDYATYNSFYLIDRKDEGAVPLSMAYGLKIIGNIFESPELLNLKDK